jgi:DNA-binding NarL/FixJ family response regulator
MPATAPQRDLLVDVCVVEDHPLYRAALIGTLTEAPGVRLAAAARSVEEFLAYRRPPGDVVLLDLGLPGLRGPAAVLAVTELGHRVVVVSAQGDRDVVLAAIAAGARGYLTKCADAADIRQAVERVAAGETYVSPTLASYLLDAARDRPARSGLALSEREREVLSLLAAGERDLDIARALSISIRTVRSHLDRIREKTGRRRRPELTRLAIEHGIVRASCRRVPK